VTLGYCVTLNFQWSSTLHGSQATVSTICAGYDRSDASSAKMLHHSWSLRLFCLDWTIATHCWPVYHAPPSNRYGEYRMQLLVWCLCLAFVITWHQRWRSYTGYLLNTESNTSCVHWCIKSTLHVHHTTWPTLCNQSLNPVVNPAWGLLIPLTTSYIALELNLVNVASVTLVQLPGIPYLTVLSLPLTPIVLKSYKNSPLSPRVLIFVSAPGHFVSRAL